MTDAPFTKTSATTGWTYTQTDTADSFKFKNLSLVTADGSYLPITPLSSLGQFSTALIPAILGGTTGSTFTVTATTLTTAALTVTTYARTATTQSTLFSTASSAAGFPSQAAASSFLSNMNNVIADLAALTTRVNALAADVSRLVGFANQFNTLLADLT